MPPKARKVADPNILSERRIKELKVLKDKISEIKARPEYAGYDFSDLDNAKSVAESKKIICSCGTEYTNSISKLYGKFPLHKKCVGKRGGVLTAADEAKIAAYRDSAGGNYKYRDEGGRRLDMIAANMSLPAKTVEIYIECALHGIMSSTISTLIRDDGAGRLCTDCNKEKAKARVLDYNEKFIAKSMRVHHREDGSPIYDYSKTKYTGAHEKVTIICSAHGEFEQSASSHKNGTGCPDCGTEAVSSKLRFNRDNFIKKAQEIHKAEDGTPRFDYSATYIDPETGLDNYVNIDQKVKIICPAHGDFWQIAYEHKKGKNGCASCFKMSKGEIKVKNYLISKNIAFTQQKTFADLKNINRLRMDFYLDDLRAAIEFNGKQHYESIELWGGNEELNNTRERDNIKKEYCENNKIPLLVIKYDEDVEKCIDNFIAKISP